MTTQQLTQLELLMPKPPKKTESTAKTAPDTKYIDYKSLSSLCRRQHKFIISLMNKAEAIDKQTLLISKNWIIKHREVVGKNTEWQEAYETLHAAYQDCLKKNDEFVVQNKELKKDHNKISEAYLQQTFGHIPVRKFEEHNRKTMEKKIKKKIN